MARNYFTGGPPPLESRPSMLVVGHSWADGIASGYEAEIGGALGMRTVADAKDGASIAYATIGIKKAPGDFICALIITGINDFRKSQGDVKQSFEALIRAARDKVDGRVYVANVPYYDAAGKEKIDGINRDLKALCRKYPEVVCIDLNAELKSVEGGKRKHPEYSPARLHPASYAGIREFLINEVRKGENEHRAATMPSKAAH